MSTEIDILAIDDDKFVQKMIVKALTLDGWACRVANNGEEGIAAALDKLPDIILLDVEMPGINGYETCDRLRALPETNNIPIVFLSSHGSLRERLQGYEVGGDDYLVKPFETEHLVARIRVLLRFRDERRELHDQYVEAKAFAMQAMAGSSELGHAMRFLERVLGYTTLDQISQGLFEFLDSLSLDTSMMILSDGDEMFAASDGAISPLEKELLEMSDRENRFLDFGARTIVNFPAVSLLVRNMPLENPERYGQLKDLLPIILSAVNTKISVLATQQALTQQSQQLFLSFQHIRSNLYHLARTILTNRKDSHELMQNMVHNLNYDLLRMGLEEDQEEYLLNRIDSAIEEALEQMDAGAQIRSSFTTILQNIATIIDQQHALQAAFDANQASDTSDREVEDDGIELF